MDTIQPKNVGNTNVRPNANGQIQQTAGTQHPTAQPVKPQAPQKPVQNNQGGKKKSKLPIIIAAVIVIGIVGFCIWKFALSKEPEPEIEVTPTEAPTPTPIVETAQYKLLKQYISAVQSKDPYQIDDAVGIVNADSFVAHEYAYANSNEQRLYFIQRICSLFDVEGLDIQYSGGSVACTVPDYEKISAKMQEDVIRIKAMYNDLGIKPTDLNFGDVMLDFMLRYITDIQELPTISANVEFEFGTSEDGIPYLVSDASLDDFMFGNESFHNMCDEFVKLCTDYTTTVEVTVDNPEYLDWKEKLDKYMADEQYADKWALRQIFETDADGNPVLGEDKQPIVKKEYYVLITKSGKDKKAPAKTITETVDNPFIQESVIPYNWCGSHYIQTEYNGIYSKIVTLGDGDIKNPAGVGTPIRTKAITESGDYVDVEVTLVNYWVRQEAIDYVESLSTRNHGFTSDSKLDLIVCELAVKNLSGKKATIKSELMLSDDKGNKSTRTGTVFGTTDSVTLEPGDTAIINDWLTSTVLDTKYLAWGSSFARKFNVLYFAVLAGTPEVPSYSPYSVNLEAVLGYYGTHKYNNMDITDDNSIDVGDSASASSESGTDTQ